MTTPTRLPADATPADAARFMAEQGCTPTAASDPRADHPPFTYGLIFDVFDVFERYGWAKSANPGDLARTMVHLLHAAEAYNGTERANEAK